MAKTITIKCREPYDLSIGKGLIGSDAFVQACQNLSQHIVVIADERVASLYGKRIAKILQEAGLMVHVLTFPAGEQHKTRDTKEYLEDAMFALGCGRDIGVLGLGGGVTTDMAGFVAATYCRGVPVMYVPTSLLAMVDASVGGKTGVNTPHGKNLVGVFYQPRAVFIDVDMLRTLPAEEYNNGMAEVMKHALLTDARYFEVLPEEEMIYRSCMVKKNLIEQDEHDRGIRQLLNFGHTIGHALEAATHGMLRHGEAVALGMVAESYMAMRLGYLPESVLHTIEQGISRYLPIRLQIPYSHDLFWQALRLDKKNIQQQPRFVLLKDMGKVCYPKQGYTHVVSDALIDEAVAYVSSRHSL